MTRASRGLRVAAACAATTVVWGLVGVVIAPPAGAATVSCPAGNLQAAINAAPPGSTINVSGTCTGNFSINKNLRLVGPAVLDGGGSGTVLTTNGNDVRLLELTIRNGNFALGGGIRNSGGLTLQNTRVTNNVALVNGTQSNQAQCTAGSPCTITQQNQIVAATAGGIVNSGTLTLNASVVTGNTGTAMGSLSQTNNGGCTVSCTMTQRNSVAAEAAGGILNRSGTARIANGSVVSGNTANARGSVSQANSVDCDANCTVTQENVYAGLGGGGILSETGTLTIVDSTVANNTTIVSGTLSQDNSATCNATCTMTQVNSINWAGGGGITLRDGGSARLAEVRVASNDTVANGGGILNLSSTLTTQDTDVVANHSDRRGGGIYNDAGSISLLESLVARNSAGTDGGGIYNNAGSVQLSDTAVQNNTPNNCVGC